MTERRIRESPGYALGRRVQYERGENEPPSVAVAIALARYFDEDPTSSSTKLYDYVDPEALDALFGETDGGTDRTATRIEFDVDDVTVVVQPTRVEIAPSA
ncbi:HalOD1 output domain-containing protein [Natrarchaeobius oligotrophus]|uniref:Halobacterial output domain-containing protein n=1 Tax=Natrarchaeobius chitinivorans TaxID=1679083 RepID=A0A3N6NI74_NATCH|nr:HalOD1 output domain-containing protein [Natrarchaeobius chitinivorans]RQG98842.1 hypothetical protein EA472_16640 [Natrarchaeobius chitinivorans]